jgi:SSS family solute:Na+ symporter/sodium/pantothenate symporter
MFTKDIYAVHVRPDASEAELTRVGKRCSWIVVSALAVLAIVLKDHASLIGLLDRKFDVLVQLAPAFMLGIHWAALDRRAILQGLIAGLAVSLTLAFGPFSFVVGGKVWGIHPGLYGLAVNLAIVLIGSMRARRSGRVSHDVRPVETSGR